MALVAAAAAPALAAAPRADLAMVRVKVTDARVTAGSSLPFRATVANRGKRAVSASRLRVRLTSTTPGARPQRLVPSRKVPRLRKGRRKVVRARIVVPAQLAPGAYRMRVCVVAKRAARERKKSNNCRSLRGGIDVLARPGGGGGPLPGITPPPEPSPGPPTPAGPETTITSAPAAVDPARTVTFAFEADQAGSTFACRLDDEPFAACSSPQLYSDLSSGPHVFEVRATAADGTQETDPARHAWRVAPPAPAPGPADAAAPDPAPRATPLPPGEVTPFLAANDFLLDGADPVQDGADAGAFDAGRASVLRGRVLNRIGAPIPGVRVSAVDHPEFGRTATRTDGRFDLLVNTGEALLLEFEREGFLTAQRSVESSAHAFASVPEVVLIPYDDAVTEVRFGEPDEAQAHEANVVEDAEGSRRARLVVPPGTTAELVMPDGSTQAVDDLDIRATEYTIGANGPAAMPAELPPTSGYTYAVELSADQAVAAGAEGVSFSQPVFAYVDNFLGFPAGEGIPSGALDSGTGEWVPQENGMVVTVLAGPDGARALDLDGDGQPEGQAALTAAGVTPAELELLAGLFEPGEKAWRIPVDHFSAWDWNLGWRCVDANGDGVIQCDYPGEDPPDNPGPDPCDGAAGGSIIRCEPQVLQEEMPIAGTSLGLAYSTHRMPGYRAGRSVDVGLTVNGVSGDASRVELRAAIGPLTGGASWANNQLIAVTEEHDATAGRTGIFVAPDTDPYGRPLVGRHAAHIAVSWRYPVALTGAPASGRTFAVPSSTLGLTTLSQSLQRVSGRNSVTLNQEFEVELTYPSQPASALGGWTIDEHHVYDIDNRRLQEGDGSVRESTPGLTIETEVGAGGSRNQQRLRSPAGLALTAGGALLVAERGANVVRRFDPDGSESVLAGTGEAGFSGDGGPAAQARLDAPRGLAIMADGSVLVADTGNRRVRRIAPDGTISTFAGNGQAGSDGDGGEATAARLTAPVAVAADPSGLVYISDRDAHVIRQVTPGGLISTFAGRPGQAGSGGDGGPATRAGLREPHGLSLRRDGVLFVADAGNNRVRQIDPMGLITNVAGSGCPTAAASSARVAEPGCTADGAARLALAASADSPLDRPEGVATLADGTAFIAETGSHALSGRRPAGTLDRMAGDGVPGTTGDGGPSARARLDSPEAVLVAPDGTLFVADTGNERIRRVEPTLPGFRAFENAIPSADAEQVHVFDPSGRHLRTVDALTGADVLSFEYDAAGLLTAVVENETERTEIERLPDGTATALVAPTGQRTALEHTDGMLTEITGPAGTTDAFTYDAGDLLTEHLRPGDRPYTYGYDSVGRLVRAEKPGGDAQTFSRELQGRTVEVTRRTPGGRTIVYTSAVEPDGTLVSTEEEAGRGRNEVRELPDGTFERSSQTGDQLGQTISPDPRFGMLAPFVSRATVTHPSGRERVRTIARSFQPGAGGAVVAPAQYVEEETVAGDETISTWSGAARTLSERSPAGRITTTTFDAFRRPTRLEIPGMTAFDVEYDARGRPTQVSAGGRVYQTSYDAFGNIADEVLPDGVTLEWTGDAEGRYTQLEQPGGRIAERELNAAGETVALTPPGRPSHGFSYDSRGRRVELRQPVIGGDADATTFAYEPDDALVRADLPGGFQLGATLGAGRYVTRTEASGTTTFEYAADALPLTGVTSPNASPGVAEEHVEYDRDASLIDSETIEGTSPATIARTFDAKDRTISESVNGNATAYSYDADDLITGAGPITVNRSAASGLVSSTSMGQVSESVTRNGFGEVTARVFNGPGGVQLYREDTTLEGSGNVSATTVATQRATTGSTFEYDAGGRLAAAVRDGARTNYAYDANSNRTSRGPTTATFDVRDRLVTHGAEELQYTRRGTLASKTDGADVTDYDYDERGFLRSVDLPDGRRIAYGLDHRGNPVARRVDGATTNRWVWSSDDRVVAELAPDDSVATRFVYGAHTLFTGGPALAPDAMIRGAQRFRFVLDRLGSVRLVVDADTGAVEQELDYDEYGRVLTDTNPGFQPFGFAGGLYDPDTGLARLGVRDYDAETGRFTTPDPSGVSLELANLYAYANADPVNEVDVDGLASVGGFFGSVVQGFKGVFKKGAKKETKKEAGAGDCEDAPNDEERRICELDPVVPLSPADGVKKAGVAAIRALQEMCAFGPIGSHNRAANAAAEGAE